MHRNDLMRLVGVDTKLAGLVGYMIWPSYLGQVIMVSNFLEAAMDLLNSMDIGGKGGIYWGIGRWCGVSASGIAKGHSYMNTGIFLLVLAALVGGRCSWYVNEKRRPKKWDGNQFFERIKRSIEDEIEGMGVGGGDGKGPWGLKWEETNGYFRHLRHRWEGGGRGAKAASVATLWREIAV